jgi:hypothetical protein
MDKADLKWEPWYAWYPVFLEESGVAWLEMIEQAYDPDFYDGTYFILSCPHCGYSGPTGIYFYRRIPKS